MSGIAGVFEPGARSIVERMLEWIEYRGPGGRKIIETDNATFGIAWSKTQEASVSKLEQELTLRDEAGDGHCAEVKITDGHPVLMRDPLGVAPLYYGMNSRGNLCFASEVKAFTGITHRVNELLPGNRYDGKQLELYFKLKEYPPIDDPVEKITLELSRRLTSAVEKCIGKDSKDVMGSWLSGGLDSSTLAALARPHVKTLYTFAAGLSGAPDLEFAREVAAFIKSDHHEVILTLDSMLEVLPASNPG